MASIFDTADCTRLCVSAWKELHMTKVLLLCMGLIMTTAGFYIVITLPFSEFGPWVISALFVCAAGILTVIYSLLLFWCRAQEEAERNGSTRRNGRQSDSNEYLIFFRNSPAVQPPVYVHAPASRGLFNASKSSAVGV